MAAANAIAAVVLFVSITDCAGLVLGMRIVPKASVVPAAGVTASVGINESFATKASEEVPFRAG
jgi:hypothetical protein